MEDFRNIADETFPSFLANSLNSNTSGILENVTISSNLGLPVAASTVARNKTGCDNRLSDIQASYLEEGRFSLPSASSHSGQSASEPRGKLQYKLLMHFCISIDDDDDDDIDDEEFYDNQLEAYFHQLVSPEVPRGDCERQELSECSTALKLLENGLKQVSLSIMGLGQQLNGTKTGGPDNLHPRILKELAHEIASPLARIFNESVNSGVVPYDWRIATFFCTPLPCSKVNSAFYDLDDPPHSVVYQNEEGKWVTDLAYYTSFDKEQDLNLPADNKISEDFITASEAIAKIAQDQEEFERDHRFLQEEKIDTHNTSEVEDTSWKSANSYNLLKASQTTSDLSKDASYLRLSLGEFFGQRSEALGCLGGGSDVRRPSFGYHITSPEKRQPVALLRQSDASRGNSEQEMHTREYPDSVSATFTVDEMETTAGINKSINTQTATESKIEERLDKSKSEDKLPDFTDPILSISTIASAIANASASADPSQLAAMIMALSNKSREKPFLPEADKYTDLSFINQLLSSKKEKHNAFNMEKYLKKTEEAGHESEPENFTRSDVSVHDLIWDSSLPYKHKSQDTQAADFQTNSLTNSHINYSNENKETSHQVMNKIVPRSSNDSVKRATTESTVSTNSLKLVQQSSIPLPTSPTKAKSTQKLSKDEKRQGGKMQKGIKEASATCNNFVKHVTFEKPSVTSPKSIDQKPMSSECDLQSSEDEQYSFRPSTSPLIHSSPSEASGTTLSGSEADSPCIAPYFQSSACNDSTLIQSVCSSPSMSRLTYVSATDNTLKNISNNASELSTTIIRSSPTPLVEQTTEKPEDFSWQRNRRGTSLNTSQKNVNEKSEASESTSPSNKLEDSVPNHKLSRECLPRSENEFTSRLSSLNMVPTYSTVSSAIPTLLTGRSLATTAFAQQYLGNMQSSGNVALSQYGGSCTGCCLPPGLPFSSIPAGHVQNSVTVGIPLGPSVGPGLLGTSSLCNPHSGSWNPNILTKYFPLPQKWFSFLGHVRVPEELKFPNACCVGIASQTSLGIFNPTERWLQVSIGIFSISINGEKMDPLKCQCLVFKNKTIIGPHSTEELKILFLPCHPGIYQCVFSISSWPVSADAETIVQAEALATRVVLTAVAENPNLEVETGKTDGLDFGDLSSGSWKALPLKLINKTHASVPIRLLIKANAVAWRCFTFSKEPVNTFIECSPQTDANSQLAAPSVVNHVIHASYDGQDPEILVVWVLFHAPKKQISLSDILGPADEFLARVDVEVDSPGPTSVIKSIPLRARAGTARIHAPKDLQVFYKFFFYKLTKQQLPLKNAGNIEVYLKIKVGKHNCISVEPEDLFLMPGEEQEVAVLFSPKDLKTSSESILKILVLPSGPQYEVVVKGEVNILGNRPLATTSCYSDIPPILSNKQFMAWGGVTLGRTVQQKLTLRNNSPSATQHLRLLIRGQDQNCFQLRNTFGTEERLTSNQELKIRPREDTNIFLMFAPTHVACMLAKLEIKQLGIQSQPGIKFTIPLSGYGGTSNVILENVKKLSDSYMVTLNELLPDKFREVTFRIRNMGSRAAYVKALCFRDLQSKAVMDPKVMIVSPEKFVLKEGTQEVVTVTCNLVEREEMLHKTNTSLLSTICFFCGDEVSRQQYRRAVLYKPEAAKQILPQNSMLRNITFDEEFQGEQLVTEVYDLPQRTNDIELFYGNMRKVILSVVGDSSFKRDCLQQSPGHSLESDRLGSTDTHTNTTLDVLPVKGPQGPPLSLHTDDPVQNKLISRETWAVQPEHLILTSPSISGTAETGHIQIMNNCNRSLKFELSWPAHCLTITPQHGVIEPETSILILVSPNPSLATKSSVFPWSGLIYIHCDNGQKFIKVQIREDIAQDVSSTGSASKKLDVLTPSSESVIHMIKPLPKLPSTKVEIKNRTIIFPETRFGESSENYLEMENNGNEDVRWHLSSFAPPYVKGVDESGDVYRATYIAFRCSRVSGTLGAHGKEKVAIIFLPRDRGDYAQFWDLECHPLAEPHMKHKLRFQLSGVGAKTENEAVNAKVSTCALIKTEIPVMPRRRAGSEASTLKTGQNEVIRGVYSREDHYTFLPTRVGESSTLKVNLRNNTFITHVVIINVTNAANRLSPFYRSQHYINLPVQFKPKSAGRFEGLLVVHIDKYGSLGIRLLGEAHAKE
uniref:Centrosomal protein 192 n=1 Tax=Terrapene triunguis TaxID=2587831 RepID=A0A674ISQ7_9SAUR